MTDLFSHLKNKAGAILDRHGQDWASYADGVLFNRRRPGGKRWRVWHWRPLPLFEVI